MLGLKVCRTLGEVRPLELFHQDSKSSDGYAASCKVCKNTKRRFYRRVGLSANMTREQDRNMFEALQREREDSRVVNLPILV